MSQLILYHSPYSPFSRSVLLLCHHLKLDVKVIELNLAEGEHLRSGFTRINPQRCVPTLDDDGFILWESRAILSYLAATKGQHLIPQSLQEKAKMNQRLFSEMNGIALKYAEIFRPLFNNDTELDQNKIKELYEIFSLINDNYFSDENKWIAGEELTVADFAFASTVAGLIATGASIDKLSRLKSWYQQCKTTIIDFDEINESGAEMFADWVNSIATKCFDTTI